MRWYEKIPGGPSKLLCPVESSTPMVYPYAFSGVGGMTMRFLPAEVKAAWTMMAGAMARVPQTKRLYPLPFNGWNFEMVQWWGMMDGTCVTLNKKDGVIVMSDDGRKTLIIDSGMTTIGGWMRSPQRGKSFTSLASTRRSLLTWLIRGMGDGSVLITESSSQEEYADSVLFGQDEITVCAALFLPTELWNMYAEWCTICGIHKKKASMPFPYVCLSAMEGGDAGRGEGFTLNGRPGFWCYGSTERPACYSSDPMKAWWLVRGKMLHKADRVGNNFVCDMAGLIWDARKMDESLREVSKSWPKRVDRDQRFLNNKVWSFWLEEVRRKPGWGVVQNLTNPRELTWISLDSPPVGGGGEIRNALVDTSGRCPVGFAIPLRVSGGRQTYAGLRSPGGDRWIYKEDWTWMEVARLASCGTRPFSLHTGLYLGAWTAMGLSAFECVVSGQDRVPEAWKSTVCEGMRGLDFSSGSTLTARLTRWGLIEQWRRSEISVRQFTDAMYVRNICLARLGQMSYVFLSQRDSLATGLRSEVLSPLTSVLRPYATDQIASPVLQTGDIFSGRVGATARAPALCLGVFFELLSERLKKERQPEVNSAIDRLSEGTITLPMRKWMNEVVETISAMTAKEISAMIWGVLVPARVESENGMREGLLPYRESSEYTETELRRMVGQSMSILDAITLIRRGEGEQWVDKWTSMGFGAARKNGGYRVDGWADAWRTETVVAQAACEEEEG